nr:RNA-directed DNA polymerase, eukaryota [Tanacetum cinerariifolium]
MGVGVPIGEITEMANIIGCEASTIPFVYLGVPVGANMTRSECWKELIDNFKTRLSRWKVKTLSVSGRLTLLKSVLGSIAIYYMSVFKTLIAIIKEIEAIRNQLFLGADTDENKITWIKWNKVMANKKDGGLGMGSLYWFNRVLLCKWKWRFMSYPSAFWVLVIKSLFGHHGGMQDSEPRGNAGSIWINILKVSHELEKKNVHLDDFLKRKVRDGLETRFWDDYWIIDGLLKDLYPRVYNLEQDPESVVANMLNLAPNAPFLPRNPRGGAEKDQWHSDLARDVWAFVGQWWTLDFSSVLTIRELMSWVDDTRLHILAKKVLHVVVGTMAWSIWNFRNRNVFQKEKPKKALLFDSIVSTSFFWLSNKNNNFRINSIGFLQDPIMACNSLYRLSIRLNQRTEQATCKSQGASTPAELKRMQNVSYASAVGSIMYAVRCTRPDVAFAQNITSRFQQNPGDIHWTTVKNILKYLRNTKDMFLVYGGDKKESSEFFATLMLDI